MGEPELRAEYTEDEAYFLEAHDRLPADERSRARRQIGAVILSGLCVSLTTYLAISSRREGSSTWWLNLVVIPGIFLMFWWFAFSAIARRWAFRRAVRRHLAGQHHTGAAVFDEFGFVSSREDGRSKTHLWTDIPRVIFGPDGCFVFIDESTSFWFPRRALKSDADYGRLELLIREKVSRCEQAVG